MTESLLWRSSSHELELLWSTLQLSTITWLHIHACSNLWCETMLILEKWSMKADKDVSVVVISLGWLVCGPCSSKRAQFSGTACHLCNSWCWRPEETSWKSKCYLSRSCAGVFWSVPTWNTLSKILNSRFSSLTNFFSSRFQHCLKSVDFRAFTYHFL